MGVDVFTAYNVMFDINALRKTQDQINDKRFRMPNGMNVMCLMDIAQTKVINNDFHNWFNKQDKYLQNQFTTDSDPLQNLFGIYTDLIQNTFRTHSELILNPCRPHPGFIRNSFRAHSEFIWQSCRTN